MKINISSNHFLRKKSDYKELIKIMKICLLFLFAFTFQMMATNTHAQDAIVKLKSNSITVSQLINEIENQTDYLVVYSNREVNTSRTVNLMNRSDKVSQYLNQAFNNTGISYDFENNYIVLSTKTAQMERVAASLLQTPHQQEKIITGIVVDVNGEPIIGANIIEKNTTNGTITDVDGHFSLKVREDAVLYISYIGYLDQEIKTVGVTAVDIILLEDTRTLEELVVIGYGTRSKQALTGSIVNVNMEDMKKMNPVNNITLALQGVVPGIVANSGNTPGSGANIQIRGIGTINNTSPLIIVDGIPSDIGRLNPAEIESMSVLKDAASTAIYGARGANGVIVVSTIKGKRSTAPRVTINARTSISSLPPQYDMLDPTEYGEMLWMSFDNSGMAPNHAIYGNGPTPVIPKYIYPVVTNEVDLGRYHAYDYQIVESTPEGTNWFDYVYQNAITQDYDMTITGGAEKLTYGIVFGYTDNNGSVKESGFNRFNFRTNLSLELFDWLEIGENFGVRHHKYMGRRSDGGEGSTIGMTLLMPRLSPVYDIEGNWAPVTKLAGFSSNRSEPSEIWRYKNHTDKYLSLEGNVYAKIQFLKNFTARTTLGMYAGNGWNNAPLVANPWNYSGTTMDKLTVSSSKAENWDWNNTLNFTKSFGDHSVDAMVGFEAGYNRSDNMSASRESYFLTNEEYFVLNAGERNQTNSGSYSESAYSSYFGRLHYEYKNKYFLDGVLRHDGSSVFAERYRWGTFPSIAAGWILSQENFLNSVDWLDLLKIRASWGQSGNNRIGTYNGFSTYQTNINYSFYPMDGHKPAAGFESLAFGNPNAKWETTNTINLGLDVTVLNKLSLGIDIWKKKTVDMLFPKAIPAVYGYASAPSVNIGDMLNKGVDLTIDYNGNLLGGDFTYNLNLVVSSYKNEILALSDKEDEVRYGTTIRDQYYTFAKKGTSFPEFYGYKISGIFQSDAEAASYHKNELDPTYNKAGRFIFEDVNGDGVINSHDRTSIGSPHPDVTFGLNLNFGYKNVDLLATFYSSIGNDALNIDRRTLDFNYMEFWRGTRRLYESWGSPHLSDNANAKMPIAEINDQVSQLPSTYYVEDASYLRLRNLQLGYTFGNNVVNKIGLDNLRLFVVGQNLFTITKYTGLDPAFYNSGINLGVDGGRWPTVRSYMLGVNITF